MRATRIRVDTPSATSMASNHLATATGMLSQGASRFGINLLIGRLGGAAALGNVASAMSFAQITSLTWPAPNAAAASKFIPRARGGADDVALQSIARQLVRRAVMTTAALGTLAAATWGFFLGHGLTSGLVVFLLVTGYSGQATVNGFAYATRQNRSAAFWDASSAVGALGGVATLLAVGVSGIALALPLAAAAILQSALRWPRTNNAVIAKALRREIDRFVAIGALGTLSSAGFYQLTLVAAALTSGQKEAGMFAAAMALATPLQIVATSMSTVMFPSVAEAVGRGDTGEVRRRTDQSVRAISLVMVATAGSLAILSPVAVDLVWGSEFGATADLLPIILGGITCAALASPCVNYLMNLSQGAAVQATALSVGTSLLGILTWLWLGEARDLMTIAAGFLLAKLLFVFLTLLLVQRSLVFVDWRWLSRLGLGVLVAAAIVVLQPFSSAWAVCAIAMAFVTLWTLLNLRDVRVLATALPVPARLLPRVFR